MKGQLNCTFQPKLSDALYVTFSFRSSLFVSIQFLLALLLFHWKHSTHPEIKENKTQSEKKGQCQQYLDSNMCFPCGFLCLCQIFHCAGLNGAFCRCSLAVLFHSLHSNTYVTKEAGPHTTRYVPAVFSLASPYSVQSRGIYN